MKISVVGLGKSGIACANLAIKKGYEVFASDSGKNRTHSQMKLNKFSLLLYPLTGKGLSYI